MKLTCPSLIFGFTFNHSFHLGWKHLGVAEVFTGVLLWFYRGPTAGCRCVPGNHEGCNDCVIEMLLGCFNGVTGLILGVTSGLHGCHRGVQLSYTGVTTLLKGYCILYLHIMWTIINHPIVHTTFSLEYYLRHKSASIRHISNTIIPPLKKVKLWLH